MMIFVGSMEQEAPCFGKALSNHKGRRKRNGHQKEDIGIGEVQLQAV